MNKYQVIIIGAGASGLFTAAQLAKNNIKTLVIDMGKKPGRKILISGGGFCNFTNLNLNDSYYISNNKHYVKSAISRFTQYDFINLVDKYKIDYQIKNGSKYFTTKGAKQIVNMLMDLCNINNCIDFMMNTKVLDLEILNNNIYNIKCDNEISIKSSNIVVATGGLSMNKLGTSTIGYKIAENLNIPVTDIKAGLVPLTYREDNSYFSKLSGISTKVIVTSQNGKAFHDDLLFTHRGLSGPAILQISNYWRPNEAVIINWLPIYNSFSDILDKYIKTNSKTLTKNIINKYIPNALVNLWDKSNYKNISNIFNKNLSNISKKDIKHIDNILFYDSFVSNGTEGYRTAEVTIGGVDTNYLSSKTMEVKNYPGLFFIGEVVDVTGHLGGFNFQWCWSSSYAVSSYLISKLKNRLTI